MSTGETVADLRRRLLGCATLAALEVGERLGTSPKDLPDPKFVQAVEALPDRSTDRRSPPRDDLLLWR